MGIARKFASDKRGNFALLFALASVPVLAGVAMTLEFSNLSQNQSKLQNAIDAAVLFAGKYHEEKGHTPSNKDVKDFLAANFEGNVHGVTLKKVGDRLVLSAKSDVDAFFFDRFAKSLFKQDAEASVPIGQKVLTEIALVLDSTYSMSADDKMTSLKSVAKAFIDDLAAKVNSNADIRVGLVPFNNHVNIGLSRRSESWLDVAPDVSKTEYSCKMELVGQTASNCRMETTYNDGVPVQSQKCDWSGGTMQEVCKDRITEKKWKGCVGSRAEPFTLTDKNYSTKVPGVHPWSCPSEITPLTTALSTLKTSIDAMNPVGDTYIASGVEWGWKMLSDNAPLTEGVKLNSMPGWEHNKYMILMTDGDNQRASSLPWDAHNWHDDLVKADDWTKEICDNARKDKIIIYSIAFGTTVSEKGQAVMQECAGKNGGYYHAKDKAALKKAFDDIAGKIARLRLTS